MDIAINLWNDYVMALRSNLAASGFHIAGTESDDSIVIGFFSWQKRMVPAVPRKIHRAREFTCPAEFVRPVSQITAAIECGQDVIPYLSKTIRDLDYSDLMLNDWGVHHMHLGESFDSSGFITRTGPLLFLHFSDADAYYINVYPHSAWSKQEIVSIVHKNWPNLIKRFRVGNVLDLAREATDEDINTFRGSHINPMLKLDDGTIYAPIGLGSMSDGTAVDVMMNVTKMRRHFRIAEKAVKEAVAHASEQFTGHAKLRFILEMNGPNAYAVEEATRVAYKLW
jgi:hypothetical protein